MATRGMRRWALCVMLLFATAVFAGCVDDDDDGDAAEAEIDALKAQIAALQARLDAHPWTGFAPVPDGAWGPTINETGYHYAEVDQGLYWVTDGSYQNIFLTTGEGVIVVDAPPSLTPFTLQAIENVTSEPVTHVIYSHSHGDHIGAAAMYPEDAVYIAHDATLAQMHLHETPERIAPFAAFSGGGAVPEPDVTFADEYTLTVGSQTLELAYHGPTHEAGNIFVYAPEQKVLLLIDVIFPGWVPFMEFALAEDIPAFLASHDQVLDYDFDTLVAGHLGRLGTRADVETQKEYVFDVRDNAAAALQTVDFMAVAEEVGFGNPWALFGAYFEAIAAECARLTEPDWVDVLGGADVFTESHCFVMMESLRID